MPPAPVVHGLLQLTLARQVHDGAEPHAAGSGRQAYDGGLPTAPPMVTWQYVVAGLQNAQLLGTQAPAWSSWARARTRSQSFE
jgi:hypothetical protein